ncbi:MAG: hypothetical protein Q7S74_03430 [Nanoarchaeota archaeon]|nr:hypothetical protein [Nanoarchaeota archaeon]
MAYGYHFEESGKTCRRREWHAGDGLEYLRKMFDKWYDGIEINDQQMCGFYLFTEN